MQDTELQLLNIHRKQILTWQILYKPSPFVLSFTRSNICEVFYSSKASIISIGWGNKEKNFKSIFAEAFDFKIKNNTLSFRNINYGEISRLSDTSNNQKLTFQIGTRLQYHIFFEDFEHTLILLNMIIKVFYRFLSFGLQF